MSGLRPFCVKTPVRYRRNPVPDLADRIGMSQSAFFEHFKAVTGTSPFQYQKELRLLHARDALRGSDAMTGSSRSRKSPVY